MMSEELKQQQLEQTMGAFEDLLSQDDKVLKMLLTKAGKKTIRDSVINPMSVYSIKRSLLSSNLSTDEMQIQRDEFVEDALELYDTMELTEVQGKLLKYMLDCIVETHDLAINSIMSDQIDVPIELVHKNAKLPAYSHACDAGADIYTVEDIVLPAGSFGNRVKTGLKMAIPPGWLISIRPRSGMSAKTTMRIGNAPGTIDTGYLDELLILVDNIGTKELKFKKGTRMAQMILEKSYQAKFFEIDSVKNLEKDRSGGIGSTGE